MVKTIFIDADDTLWHNENFFRENEKIFFELLAPYGSKEEIFRKLFKTEIDNLPAYGYGIKSFVLSMLETYTSLTNSDDPKYYEIISRILELGKEHINKPVVLLEGVEEVLKQISGQYRLVIFTKGDILDQERKLSLSGLTSYFERMEVVSSKQIGDYEKLLKKYDLKPQEVIMIGNSPKSDILPILQLGGSGIFIPYLTIWEHEKVEEDIVSDRYITISSFREVPQAIEQLAQYE